MADVRSQSLVAFTLPNTGNWRIWICPAGMVTLLKHISLTSPSGAGADTALFARFGGHTQLLAHQVLALNEPFNTSVWVALNPGDDLIAQSSVANVGIWLSGAVLLGPPPVSRPTPTPTLLDEVTPLPAGPGAP